MFDGLFDLLNAMEGLGDIVSTTIARYEDDELCVSTVQSSDCDNYETALSHRDYHPSFIVVEEYAELEEAEIGHKVWLQVMQSNPTIIMELEDVGSNPIAAAVNALLSELDNLID